MLGLYIILAHLVGDYLIQNQWMADNKTSRWWPAIVHGITYTIPYIFITQSFWALFVICATHIVIDRYRLAKHFIYLKNLIAPRKIIGYSYEWEPGIVSTYTERYDNLDFRAGRPIHRDMSVAPPDAEVIRKPRPTWAECKGTGSSMDLPVWMSVWLMIIVDNSIHLLINTGAILLLG